MLLNNSIVGGKLICDKRLTRDSQKEKLNSVLIFTKILTMV